MFIKYNKELLKIVNADDIEERLNLSSKLMMTYKFKQLIMSINRDEGREKLTKSEQYKKKERMFEHYEERFKIHNGLYIYNDNGFYIGENDLSQANSINIHLSKESTLYEICYHLIFSNEKSKRYDIYNYIPNIKAFKKGSKDKLMPRNIMSD